MKMHRFRRILSLLLVATLLVGFYVPGARAASTGLRWEKTDQKIKPDISHREVQSSQEAPHNPSDLVRVSIVLEDKPTIQAGYGTRRILDNAEALAYGAGLKAKQDALANAISAQILGGRKLDVVWNLTLAANLISANVPYGAMDAIAEMEGIRAVVPETQYTPCVVQQGDVTQPQMYASLGMTGASLTWTTGYTGAGSRIAIIDTGTDTTHQSLDNGAYLYALDQNAKAAGLSADAYRAGLNLMDAQEIASALSHLNIKKLIPSVTAAQLFLNEKLPFAANYVDGNLVVNHKSDSQGEHGSHVAGIAAANRYIPSGSGYADALQTVYMAGAAPDAQILTMKVFGSRGPYDSDYMAAVEDAIYLNCDAVNLSLGSTAPGTGANDYFADLLSYMTQTDTVVVASAGNAFGWPDATYNGYLYNQDVNMDTVGAPGSYNNFFTVASVNNDGGVGMAFRAAGHTAMYSDGAYGYNNPLSYLDTSSDLSGTEYDFVFIDGMGYPEDYAGMDLSGKVVFCSRGYLGFYEKATYAVSLGAAATVIYNNDSSGIFNMDLSDYYSSAPCVSITQADADAIRSAASPRTTAAGLTYYTGKITIVGSPIGVQGNSQYKTMSNFSSWGIPGSLTLKPEITAPGGDIYSIWGTNPVTVGGSDLYELMSGTSMAAPAVTGMTALLAQYLRETGLAEQEGITSRALAQSLLMSTATPLYEEASGGEYYSLLKQGAGLARVDLAVNADSYILVDGQPDGKVKAELGDDPNRTGVYEFSFQIHNLTGKAQDYRLSADVFRQDVFDGFGDGRTFFLDSWTIDLPATATFTVNGVPVASGQHSTAYDLNGDGVVNALDADHLLEYLVGNVSTLHQNGDINGDGNVSSYDAHLLLAMLDTDSDGTVKLPAGGCVTVDVRLTLTAQGRQILENYYPTGTYVEAFVYATAVTDDEGVAGTVHSIPVLAFYGNWSDPSMFDHGTAMEMLYGQIDSTPYLYEVTGGRSNTLTIDYGDGNEYYFGGNPITDDNEYLPQRDAFSTTGRSTLNHLSFSLIRSAGDARLQIVNAKTGEVYMQKQLGELYSAYYNVNYGDWENTQQLTTLNWAGRDAQGNALPDGTQIEVRLTAVPEYYRSANGSYSFEGLGTGATMIHSMTIDNTAPEIKDMELNGTQLSVLARDNRHVAAVVLYNSTGSTPIAYASPNQTEANVDVTVNLDLDYIYGKSFLLAVYDYAMNETTYEITLELPEMERPYFTLLNIDDNAFAGLDVTASGLNEAKLAPWSIPVPPRAAEYVDGYVFVITDDNTLCVAPDEDLSNAIAISNLDPAYDYQITGFNDLAYNHADGKLYGQFYSYLNDQATPFLCTIDMLSGTMQVLAELPVDVNTMAIDGKGNFYSTAYGVPELYTYTVASVTSANPTMTYVGYTGSYATSNISSLAWDHNTDKLYWAFPNALLEIDPRTAAPTMLGYITFQSCGLYIRPENPGDTSRFDPVNYVDQVVLNHSDAQVIAGTSITLEANVWPWNAADSSVTWSSSNPAVATVDRNGLVTGVSLGSCTITATSNLDSSKRASCTVTVFSLDSQINALVWDENGDIFWSCFTASGLPGYTKLAAITNNIPLTSTAVIDGNLYASSLDTSSGLSDMYIVDPQSFAMTYVGSSSDLCYTAMAYAPNMGCLLATYFNYVAVVDPSTGDYIGAWDWSEGIAGNLVGITYYGSEYNSDYGAYMDYFLILDDLGNAYLEAFINTGTQTGYFNGPTYGLVDTIGDPVDYSYFQGFYYDGSYAYWTRFNEADNQVELLVWDCDDTGNVYNMGTFPQGVWPVGGLYTETELASAGALAADFAWEQLCTNTMAAEVSPVGEFAEPSGHRKTASGGGLNSILPQSSGEYDQEENQVTVAITGIGTAPNGRMIIEYNPAALRFTGITGHTEAFAYTEADGRITLAFATPAELPAGNTVATLTFEGLMPGSHIIAISHQEAWDEPSGRQDLLTVDIPAPEPEYTVKWASVSTTLTGNIGLNFYAQLSENLLDASDTYIRFTLCGRNIDVPLSEGVASVSNGVTRYRYTCPITAKNMTDKVSAQIMKGDTPVGDPKVMDVATYCNWIIANHTDTKTINLMKAMLNYGASAQLLFKHSTGNLANAALSPADQALPNVDASAYKHSVTGSEDGIIAKSMTLLLDSETTIRVYFELTGNKTIDDYTFQVNGQPATAVYKGGKYYVEIPNIPAHRLSQMQVVTVGGITVRYGALSYVNQVLNFAAATPETVNMAKALFVYYEAAKAYSS